MSFDPDHIDWLALTYLLLEWEAARPLPHPLSLLENRYKH